ncbi:hypothetical protein G5C65_30870, partial [Streptomyces sp. SB3404]|nr:hypothetical protein [Streptomyces boncukensis]
LDRPSTPPGVSSPDFPDGDAGWPATTGEVRTQGTFTLASGGEKDVVTYEYWMDSRPDPVKVDAPSPGADADVKLTPNWAGPQNLYVRSIDRAGNRSDTRTYLFYANSLSEPDKPGDINGSGNADLWGIDGKGILHRWRDQGDGTLKDDPKRASNTTWNNAQVTHRGDWNGDGDGYLDTSRDPVLIGDTGADHVTLAAPGDFTGDGRVDLLVRGESSGGNLYVYHGGRPDGIGIGNPEHRTRIGWNWGTDTVPLFTAAPDADNNGKLDLWATTAGSGRLRFFANHTADGPEKVTAVSEAFAGYRSLG